LLAVKAGYIPWQTDLGFLVFAVTRANTRSVAESGVVGCQIKVIDSCIASATAFLVAVLGAFPDIFPG